MAENKYATRRKKEGGETTYYNRNLMDIRPTIINRTSYSRSNKYRYIIIVKSNSSFIICYLPFIRYLSFHVHRFEKF